jgi:Trk K+ transport system NAD-binding subunit
VSLPVHRRRRRSISTGLLYARTILRRFRWTLAVLVVALAVGTVLYLVTPQSALNGQTPPLHTALYGAWMALFAQPIFNPPETWQLAVVDALYPLLGFVLVGEGIVRLSLLLVSREQGEKEWMKVTASTYRDHVVLCGLGHLGSRILAQLVEAGVPVVALEKDLGGRFLPEARQSGAPILIRDMKEDQALVDAGVQHARSIVIATNDDFANLEVALDARRLNPKIRILMRMFDQQIADKIKDSFAIDHAFSSAALAAPIVAAMCQHASVLATYPIGGVAHVAAEVSLGRESALLQKTIAEVESQFAARVVTHASNGGTPSTPKVDQRLASGDTIVVHAAADRAAALMAAARGSVAA